MDEDDDDEDDDDDDDEEDTPKRQTRRRGSAKVRYVIVTREIRSLRDVPHFESKFSPSMCAEM